MPTITITTVNSPTNLRDAFLVFSALAVIALFNAVQLREERKISVGYVNWELTKLLELEDQQLVKIQAIHAEYEREMLKVYDDKSYEVEFKRKKMDHLIFKRSMEIMEVLNEKQQKILYSYCTDLLSPNKMVE